MMRLQTNEKRCTKCGELKNLSDFYFDKRKNRHEAICKACKIAYQKERHKLIMNDPNLHNRRLMTQLKYRKRYGYKIAEKSRLERRKMGISPQQYVNKELLLELYKQGLPIETIAERCNCSKWTVKLYAYRNGVRRGHEQKRICYNCENIECFENVKNLSSNLALTCRGFKFKQKRKNERIRKQ